MILLIDAGNTRLKWRLTGTGGPLEEASEDHRSAASAMEVDNVDKNGMCGEGITDEDCYMHR